MLSLLWQSAATAGVAAMVTPADGGHVVQHWQGSMHHHHDTDQHDHGDEVVMGLQAEDTAGTVQHMQSDSASSAPVLLAAAGQTVVMMRPPGPAALAELPVPFPFLQGPLRPPKARA